MYIYIIRTGAFVCVPEYDEEVLLPGHLYEAGDVEEGGELARPTIPKIKDPSPDKPNAIKTYCRN